MGDEFFTGLRAADWGLLAVAPMVGSFVGVIIRRVPEGLPVAWSRSRCERCGAKLSPRDLMPLISWLVGRGRCRHCNSSLSWFYPGSEGAVVGIAVISLLVDRGADAWLDGLLGCWLLALGWIDLRRWILPDALTLPLIVAGIGASWLLAPGEVVDRIAGTTCGYFALRMVAWAYRKVRGREGLGAGDAKLLAAAGAWVGVTGLPSVLAGAACAALATAAVLVVVGIRLTRSSAMPFGPFLALATWMVWLFGPLIL
jgi:leader peptidase (prepilin peptidase)/N-methyltransferase